jgi:hypothetical protein
MPQFMANREILEAFVAELGRVDDGGRAAGEDDRAGHASHFGRFRLDDNIPRLSDLSGLNWKVIEAKFRSDLFAVLGCHLQPEASHVSPLFLVLNHCVDDVLNKMSIFRAQLVLVAEGGRRDLRPQ